MVSHAVRTRRARCAHRLLQNDLRARDTSVSKTPAECVAREWAKAHHIARDALQRLCAVARGGSGARERQATLATVRGEIPNAVEVEEREGGGV